MLYIVRGDGDEVRCIQTDYPQRHVERVIRARGHTLLVKTTDDEKTTIFGEYQLESLTEYVHLFADEPRVFRAMSPELKDDVLRYLSSLPVLDLLELSVYITLDPQLSKRFG